VLPLLYKSRSAAGFEPIWCNAGECVCVCTRMANKSLQSRTRSCPESLHIFARPELDSLLRAPRGLHIETRVPCFDMGATIKSNEHHTGICQFYPINFSMDDVSSSKYSQYQFRLESSSGQTQLLTSQLFTLQSVFNEI
jgi:hypothetical protein